MKIPYHGAGILLWARDEQDKIIVLLGKRSINPDKGKWSIPGGEWNAKKDLYDSKGNPDYLRTAVRETDEELKFSIEDVGHILHLWNIRIPLFHFAVYSLQLSKQRPFTHNYEFTETKWFAIDALPKPCVMFVKSQVAALVGQQSKLARR